ncbi:MAG: B12-binding domain-containing radical SAM protein [Candidatus Altiarchaeota archaeon]|nr:B12-binding domain-containing radical SAM protein [Candidatus Altiarchaeota archaeon]
MDGSRLKVVFYGFRSTAYPMLGVGYVVSYLRSKGFDYDFVFVEPSDCLEDAAKQICGFRPDIVGLSACSADFNKVKKLSSLIKEGCGSLVFLGGSHISSVPETLPSTVDVGFLGEAEETSVEVFRLLEDGKLSPEHLKDVAGVVYFDGGSLQVNGRRPYIKDLDSVPYPARDLFSTAYWKRGDTSLMTSRGCPFNCSFCQVRAEWKVCRYHSAEYVVGEIKEVYGKYGIHTFGVIDDLFIANKERIKEIIGALKREGLLGKVRFAVNGRANLMDEELVSLLKEMGVVEVALGLESMSPKILSLLKDCVTVEQNKEAVDLIYMGGLKSGGLFMIGTPGESLEDMLLTYDYVKNNRHKFGGMQVCVTTPLPKTRLWDLCVAEGKVDPDINKVEWDKLSISTEDLGNIWYVGDLDRRKFMEVLDRFKRLFFNVEEQKPLSGLNLLTDVVRKVVNPTAVSLLLKDPYSFYLVCRNYLLRNLGGAKPVDPRFYVFENSFVDPSKEFYGGVVDGDVEVVDGEIRVSGGLKVGLVGLFNKLTFVYSSKKDVEFKVDGVEYVLPVSNGVKKTFDVVLNSSNVTRCFKEVVFGKAEFLLISLYVDFSGAVDNCIVPGVNELLQADSGMYQTEVWPDGKAFWTNGHFKGYLLPQGGEEGLRIEFHSGRKKNLDEKYMVSVELKCKSSKKMFTTKFDVFQSGVHIKTIKLPHLTTERVEIIITSDIFCPYELESSGDPRTLGIGIKRIELI